MTWQSYRAKIASIRLLAPEAFELVLTLVDPPRLNFQPGQAVAIPVPASFSKTPIRRYYSLASPPSSSAKISLLCDQGEQGIASQFLRNQSVGEELVFEGPFGSFCLRNNPKQDLLFVATGTGIAPIRSMITTLLENGLSQPITLVWGLRREWDLYFVEEFERWANRYANFSFILTLTKAESQWAGARGRVTQVLKGMEHLDRFTAYVCGGKNMVMEVTALLHERGVSHVYHERHHDAT